MGKHLWQKGQVTNPIGRLPGTRNKRTKALADVFERHNFNPLEEKLKLAITLRNILRRNKFDTPEARLAHISQYSDVLKDLIQYFAPRLKQVDHYANIEIIERLQSVDQYSDAELAALLEEARELISGSQGRS